MIMNGFRIFLYALIFIVGGYTSKVLLEDGFLILFEIFFAQIQAWQWPGQFNVDFSTFLALSALWTAWRHCFSLKGLLMGMVAFVFGMGFLAPYLLWLTYQTNDIYHVFAGDQLKATA